MSCPRHTYKTAPPPAPLSRPFFFFSFSLSPSPLHDSIIHLDSWDHRLFSDSRLSSLLIALPSRLSTLSMNHTQPLTPPESTAGDRPLVHSHPVAASARCTSTPPYFYLHDQLCPGYFAPMPPSIYPNASYHLSSSSSSSPSSSSSSDYPDMPITVPAPESTPTPTPRDIPALTPSAPSPAPSSDLVEPERVRVRRPIRVRKGRAAVGRETVSSALSVSGTCSHHHAATATAADDADKPSPSSSFLTAPLSELTRDMTHIPVKDIHAYVQRPLETRWHEAEVAGKIPRPMNSFMLYRSAYAERTKEWCSQNNHQMISRLAGQSWVKESQQVRLLYEKYATIERDNHGRAHPNYKFAPNKTGASARKQRRAPTNQQDPAIDNHYRHHPTPSSSDYTPSSSPKRPRTVELDSAASSYTSSSPNSIVSPTVAAASYGLAPWEPTRPAASYDLLSPDMLAIPLHQPDIDPALLNYDLATLAPIDSSWALADPSKEFPHYPATPANPWVLPIDSYWSHSINLMS